MGVGAGPALYYMHFVDGIVMMSLDFFELAVSFSSILRVYISLITDVLPLCPWSVRWGRGWLSPRA
jgi:hypothetical protein